MEMALPSASGGCAGGLMSEAGGRGGGGGGTMTGPEGEGSASLLGVSSLRTEWLVFRRIPFTGTTGLTLRGGNGGEDISPCTGGYTMFGEGRPPPSPPSTMPSPTSGQFSFCPGDVCW